MFNYLDTIEKYSDVKAFRFLNGDDTFEVSYSQYFKDIKKCAYNLEKIIGNLDGRHIGLIGPNSYEYAVIMAALMFGRAVFVPLNYHESRENLEFAVKDSEIDTLITDDLGKFDFGKGINYLKFADALSDDAGEKKLVDFTDDEADRPMIIVYTSGTTSLSKGVVLSVGNILGGEKNLYPRDYVKNVIGKPGIKVYINFPFFHMSGILAWISLTEHGFTIYQSVNPLNLLNDLSLVKVDAAGVIPATIKLWLKAIRRNHLERLGGAKLIVTTGAPVSVEDVRELATNGIAFGQYYGMTETGGNVTFNFDMAGHISSVGKSYEDVEIQIVDGEICVKYWGNMLGYYKNQEETNKCLRDGFIYTGDLGYLDDDGYLYITGRKKNLIILSGGENVSPEEIEKKLYGNEHIRECVVFEKNDRICADIYADKEKEDEIRDYVADLNTKLPIYKRIYGIEFRNTEFEKTDSGKIKR